MPDPLQGAVMIPAAIIDYWYSDAVRSLWFRATPELDAEIRTQYEDLWEAAMRGERDDWRETARGCLALAIVLDQFPLNMYRGQARAFDSESQAVDVARHAVAHGRDLELAPDQRIFLYMPFMHSENLADQDQSVLLYEQAGLMDNLKFARHHREIVRRFGRFPHRNSILGRTSTPEEVEYLNSKEAFRG